MDKMEERDVALGYAVNFVAMALMDLVHCLKNNGALRERQYEAALRNTISQPGAPTDRLDYQFLKNFVEQLEKQHPGGIPPDLDAIH